MEFDEDFLKQLLLTFRGEVGEQSDLIVQGLLELEKKMTTEARQAQMQQLFRAAHNVKGAAKGVGLEPVVTLAHKLETLFSGLKNSDQSPRQEVINLALEGIDKLRKLGRELAPGDAAPEDMAHYLAQLEALDISPQEEAAPVKISQPQEEPLPLPPVAVREVSVPIIESDEVPASPSDSALSDQKVEENRILRIPSVRLDQTIALADEMQIYRLEMEGVYQQARKLETDFHDLRHVLDGLSVELQKDAKLDSYRKTEVSEHLPDLMGEIGRRALILRRTTKERKKRLDYLSTRLQNSLHMMRLVALSTITQSLLRNTREIGQQLGKQARLEVYGDSIELDRFVLDQLRSPLVHLLRNALDHGIESPEERLGAGKPPEGDLTLEITDERGWITLSLKDDGRGLDLERVREKAIERGILTRAEARELAADKLQELIFLPGFSCRDDITQISGRGIGLDVVRSNLREIQGRVWVESQRGEGTRFYLQVPLTMATDHGLHISCAGESFVFPIASIDRMLAVEETELHALQSKQVVELDGRSVPVYELSDLLGLNRNTERSDTTLSLVALTAKGQQIALVVDEIIGEQEIVIKSFQPPLISVRHFKGGCLNLNGQTVLVMDPGALVETALSGPNPRLKAGGDRLAPPASTVHHILLVDDSITTRMLEKNILETQGFKVSIAVDGADAWNRLEKESFDLVISDIEMPGLDGFWLINEIRSNQSMNDMPVIIVSSLESDENKRRAMEGGADAYIVKGEFETASFLEMIKSFL